MVHEKLNTASSRLGWTVGTVSGPRPSERSESTKVSAFVCHLTDFKWSFLSLKIIIYILFQAHSILTVNTTDIIKQIMLMFRSWYLFIYYVPWNFIFNTTCRDTVHKDCHQSHNTFCIYIRELDRSKHRERKTKIIILPSPFWFAGSKKWGKGTVILEPL